MSYCQNKVINVVIHVAFEDELYKLNSYSKYYSYSCYPDETLIDCKDEDILNERINLFNNNKMSLCDKNCIFMGYDTEKQKVICKCEAKRTFSSLTQLNNKKNYLGKSQSEPDLLFPTIIITTESLTIFF